MPIQQLYIQSIYKTEIDNQHIEAAYDKFDLSNSIEDKQQEARETEQYRTLK